MKSLLMTSVYLVHTIILSSVPDVDIHRLPFKFAFATLCWFWGSGWGFAKAAATMVMKCGVGQGLNRVRVGFAGGFRRDVLQWNFYPCSGLMVLGSVGDFLAKKPSTYKTVTTLWFLRGFLC